MPVEKHKVFGTPDVMKAEDGNDSLDNAIKKAIGREPFLSFPRASDSPVQWIQLLHALDQQELPSWPLLSPLKVQLQKCEKCSREFCSSINYRRHIRAHHRLKKIDKDSTKNRDLLGAYWDKLSAEEAREVLSLENVTLEEEVLGSSILKALASLVRKQGFSSLPQYYLKAGSALLDIVQARSSILSISSKELFGILDDASEKTFLCGAAVSMQKYIFDGELGKIGLEPKNLVACTSFLLEHKLVKAWLADKEAEALRCQKLLVEEEEAAQKRQAEILERKRQKKLRQKEQKARGQKLDDEAEMKKNGSNSADDNSLAEAFSDTRDSDENNPDAFAVSGPSLSVPFHCMDTDERVDGCSLSVYDCGTNQNIEQGTSQGHVSQQVVARPKPQWAVANGFYASHNTQTYKTGIIQKYESHPNQKAASMLNGSKIWSRKPKQKTIGVHSNAKLEKESDEGKNHEVLIGSISVTLGNGSQSDDNPVAFVEDCVVGNSAKQSNDQEKPVKPDSIQISNNQFIVKAVKLWRPVTYHGTKHSSPPHSAGPEADAIDEKKDHQNLSDQNSLRSCDSGDSDSSFGNGSSHIEGQVGPRNLMFSSQVAKAFLAERWKKAMSSNHVKLVLSPNSEPTRLLPSSSKSKTRMKPEKGVKIKYIPKQRTAT